MKQKNITFAKLQEMTAIPDATLNNYFAGKVKNPKVSNVLKIAEALDIPQESLHLDIPENPTVPDKAKSDCAACDRVRTLELLLSKEEGKSEHAAQRIADIKEQTERRVAEVTHQAQKRIEETEADTDRRTRDHKAAIAVLFVLFVCAVIFSTYEVITVDKYVHNRGVITYETPAPTATPKPSSETHANLPGDFGKWYLSQTWSDSDRYLWERAFACLADGKDRSLEAHQKIKKPVFIAVIIGNYYHIDENCNALADAHTIITVDEAEAIARGFGVCNRCSGM